MERIQAMCGDNVEIGAILEQGLANLDSPVVAREVHWYELVVLVLMVHERLFVLGWA